MINSINFQPCNFHNKIVAIKVIRSITGWGLKESKDFIDSISAGNAITLYDNDIFKTDLDVREPRSFINRINRDLQYVDFKFTIEEKVFMPGVKNLDEDVRNLAKKAIDDDNFELAIKLLKVLMGKEFVDE